ncbi:MAG: hypothetical protein AB7O96_13645 [Pseudobdellovibrionaceae bacterium]
MSIRDYLPKKEKMTTLQVKLPERLVKSVQGIMKSDNYGTWQEFITACFNAYLESKKEVSEESTKAPSENRKDGK